jgi:anti-sigma-K factor RskA
MVFDTMRSNAELAHQYQLWIFDQTQRPETPVDGGVFDVAASAERLVIPIDAKLRVERPALFAVTLERPGGVVVSDRERLLLTAEVPSGR